VTFAEKTTMMTMDMRVKKILGHQRISNAIAGCLRRTSLTSSVSISISASRKSTRH
jgi:hypothetical protein